MKRLKLNLNTYLSINLVLLVLLLLGIWRGRPVWDTSLSMPTLMFILVIINSVIIFRESLVTLIYRYSGRKRLKSSGLSDIRSLFKRPSGVTEGTFSEAHSAILKASGFVGSLLFKQEEHSGLCKVAVAGMAPYLIEGTRLSVFNGKLTMNHPSTLGEEIITEWGSFHSPIVFSSRIIRLKVILAPLFFPRGLRGIWVLYPGVRSNMGQQFDLLSALMESFIAMEDLRVKEGDARYLDSETGLFRWENFNDALDNEVERSERYSQQITLLKLTIKPSEELKVEATDAVKKCVALALRESLRKLDLMFCGKVPGEFRAILTEASPEVGLLIAGRIQSSFAKQISSNEWTRDIGLKMYIGAASYPEDATHAQGLEENAEDALAEALRSGTPLVSRQAVGKS